MQHREHDAGRGGKEARHLGGLEHEHDGAAGGRNEPNVVNPAGRASVRAVRSSTTKQDTHARTAKYIQRHKRVRTHGACAPGRDHRIHVAHECAPAEGLGRRLRDARDAEHRLQHARTRGSANASTCERARVGARAGTPVTRDGGVQ